MYECRYLRLQQTEHSFLQAENILLRLCSTQPLQGLSCCLHRDFSYCKKVVTGIFEEVISVCSHDVLKLHFLLSRFSVPRQYVTIVVQTTAH